MVLRLKKGETLAEYRKRKIKPIPNVKLEKGETLKEYRKKRLKPIPNYDPRKPRKIKLLKKKPGPEEGNKGFVDKLFRKK